MRVTNISSTRRGVMFSIALLSCFQIIIGFILIMGGGFDSSAQDTNILKIENIVLTNISNDVRILQ